MTCSSYCALLRVVRDDDDRLLVEHLVEERVGRQELVERVVERHAGELHGVRPVLILGVVRDVDAARAACCLHTN